MPKRDLSHRDASDYAASEIENLLKRDNLLEDNEEPELSAEEAMKDNQVYDVNSRREVTRVLFVSQDTELLNPTQQSLDGYVDISDLFDEVHILILRAGIPPKNPVLRVAKNVWLYTATDLLWWQTPWAGLDMAEDQLEFAKGFRADLIVARDPFESAYVAYRLAKKYKRPMQLHVMDDFSTQEFFAENNRNFWRLFLPALLVPRFKSVRAQTSVIRDMLKARFKIKDLNILPRFQDYKSMIEKDVKIDLKSKYKPKIFFMLFIGRLDSNSNFRIVLDAASWLLRNPRMGLIVIGDGPEKSNFQKRVKALEIEGQVIFEKNTDDVLPYLKSAHVLLIGDTDAVSEEVVLKGAAAGIPMIMSRTPKREDVFRDGQSAFICDKEDMITFRQRIDELLNSVGLRKEFTMNSQDIIREQFFNDPESYRLAYRSSIEKAFFVNVDQDEDDKEI